MATLGERLQSVRKRRGLTQRELAKLSGVSFSLVSKIEQGELSDTRLETLRRLASALKVPTAELIVRDDVDDAQPETVTHWRPVRDALNGIYGEQPDEAPTVQGVDAALTAAMPMFQGNQYSELGTVLPALLRDADALDSDGRSVRTRLLHLAGLALTQTRQYDMADVALQRSLDDSTDRLEAVATVNSLCWLLMRQGKLADTLDLAVRWADDVEPRMSRATKPELAAWGGMLIRVSTVAVRNNQSPDAEDAIRLARGAAVTLGHEYASPEDPMRAFGPITVAMKRAENALIEDQPNRLLTIAERIPTSPPTISRNGAGRANRNRHLLDVAQAHVKLKHYAEAFDTLQDVRQDAPEWIVNQRFARDTLNEIIRRRRTLTSEMREFADFMRLPY